MKIYNKREFIWNVLFASLGILVMVKAVIQGREPTDFLMWCYLTITSIVQILESLSVEANAEDADERSQLIQQKAGEVVLSALRWVVFAGYVLFGAALFIKGAGTLVLITAPLIFLGLVMSLTEMIARLYYEKRL